MSVITQRPAARGSEERVNALRGSRAANRVGSIADGAVRVLLRIRRGDEQSRHDPALAQAREFLETFAEVRPVGARRDPLRVSRLMAWASESEPLMPRQGAEDANAASLVLRELAGRISEVQESPHPDPDLVDVLIHTFDSLADMTLTIASESSRSHIRPTRWSRT